MGSKRPSNCSDSALNAELMHAFTGVKYDINFFEEFVIGRSLACSVIIEDLFISRRHCIISYKDGKFYIKDNNTTAGTYLNCQLLPKENEYSVVLKHGDLIGFSDQVTKNYVYKFCLSSYSDKKPRLDESVEEKINDKIKIESAPKPNEEYLKTLKKMHNEILEHKVDILVFKNEAKTHISEMQKLIDETVKLTNKCSTEAIKIKNEQKVVIEDLSKKASEYLKKTQEQMDNKVTDNELLQSYKMQISDLLENDCQCPICNEVVLKAHTANCHHTFCEGCITKWLSLKKFCPICRSTIKATHYSLLLDNFITNLCNMLGGSAKHQRDVLKEERKRVPSVVSYVPEVRHNNDPPRTVAEIERNYDLARTVLAMRQHNNEPPRRGRRNRIIPQFSHIIDLRNDLIPVLPEQHNIPVVDLTNSFTSTSSTP